MQEKNVSVLMNTEYTEFKGDNNMETIYFKKEEDREFDKLLKLKL